jgi:hypothetical protein
MPNWDRMVAARRCGNNHRAILVTLGLRLPLGGISLAIEMRALRVLGVVLFSVLATAASKPHVVGFGSAQPVKLFIGPSEDKTLDITVRALYVDSKLKEFTTGKPHDVTDREFVVRRAFRINDALPDDPRKSPKWLWQRGGWLLVDRGTGRITPLKLPDFDPFYSEVSWYRDYAAYCGVSGNAERLLAVVGQIGVKKPLYRKELGKASGGDSPDSDCAAPHWDRQPARVTFLPTAGEKFSVNVSGHVADSPPESSAEEQ